VFERLAGTGPIGAGRAAIFDTETDARAFFDELVYMLAAQMARAQFNRNGSIPACSGPTHRWASQGHFYVDFQTGKLVKSNPPTSIRSLMRCFISRSRTTWSTKAGSWTCGCGSAACSNTAPAPATNFSNLRGDGEKLAGGGRSSGLMSFLKIGDRAAGAINPAAPTRRAAKMVIRRYRPPRHRAVHQLEGDREQKVANLVTRLKINSGTCGRSSSLRELRRLGR